MSEASNASSVPSQSSPIDVVIAEDSRIQARMLERILLRSGYAVRMAPDGAAALDLIREQPPQIVVSDIEMPNMSGYELCEAVKGDPQLRRVPLILLSTLSSPEDIIKGLHAGADNYVTKPYQADYLLSRIESLLQTPLGVEDEEDESTLQVTLAGAQYQVKSGRQQVLNLLISTFENAVEKNNELIRVNQELTLAKDQLARWNRDLESLNGKLEAANTRMSRDLGAAAKVQQSLLPNTTGSVGDVQFAWKYVPCDELAGDFLNYFALDDRHLAFFVVDVSGHGVASSLLSVTIGRFLTPQVSASSLLIQPGNDGEPPRIAPPAEVAAELNRRFPMEEQNGLYFTIAYGVLDTQTGKVRYVSAGHVAPAYQRTGEETKLLPAEGFAIGWIDGMDFDEVEVELKPGDRLFLYSDGVPEAMSPEMDEYGDDRMLQVLEDTRSASLEDAVTTLQEAVKSWCADAGPKDDISILALELPNSAT